MRWHTSQEEHNFNTVHSFRFSIYTHVYITSVYIPRQCNVDGLLLSLCCSPFSNHQLAKASHTYIHVHTCTYMYISQHLCSLLDPGSNPGSLSLKHIPSSHIPVPPCSRWCRWRVIWSWTGWSAVLTPPSGPGSNSSVWLHVWPRPFRPELPYQQCL